MNLIFRLTFFAAIWLVVVTLAYSQDYAPLIHDDTCALVRVNLETFESGRIVEQFQEVVQDAVEYFVIDDDIREEFSERAIELATFLVEPLQDANVKVAYLSVNATTSEESVYCYLAIPDSHMSDEDKDALEELLETPGFEYCGFYITPIFSKFEDRRDTSSFEKEYFSGKDAVRRPEIERGFERVAADEAIVTAVILPTLCHLLREDRVFSVADGILSGLQARCGDLDVGKPFSKLVESLLACRREEERNLMYRALSLNLSEPQFLVAQEFNTLESAQNYQRLVENETLLCVKEVADVMAKGYLQQSENEDADQIGERLCALINSSLDCVVKFERDESLLWWKLNAEFFFKNRKVLKGLVARIGKELKDVSTVSSRANILKLMALACLNYHDVNMRLPAAYTTDGKTWREAETLRPFLHPEEFPDDVTLGYAMLVDKDGIFSPTPGKSVNLAQITDGLYNTIMLVELADPKDERACITLEEFYKQLQDCPESKEGYLVCCGDGHVGLVEKTIALETLRELTTKDGGEMVATDKFVKIQKKDAARAQPRAIVGETRRRLYHLALAFQAYHDANMGLPSAYPEKGVTWIEAKTLDKILATKMFRDVELKVEGCAMIVADDGIFPPRAGASTRFDAVTDGLDNTIMLVELADSTDRRGVITVEDFYEQLQNCPADRAGYYVAMGSSRIMLVDKRTTLKSLKKLVSKDGGDDGMLRRYER